MDNLKEFNSNNSGGDKTYKLIIAILAVLLIGFAVLFINQLQKTNKIIAELNDATVEKNELTNEYESLLLDYEDIETTNDSISSQLTSEKKRIEDLIAELKTTKAQNKSEIRKYKKELKTLRDIMKGFIHQIDELNTANLELTAENKEIKKQIYSEKSKSTKLTKDLEAEKGKVAIASVIKAVDVQVLSYNAKGKSTSRAKKVKRLAVKFVLDENAIAPRGVKQVFVRFTDSQNHVLIQDEQPTFDYEEETITYSSIREIEYDGAATEAVIYYEHKGDEILLVGTYQVDIFVDGVMVGTSTMTLN